MLDVGIPHVALGPGKVAGPPANGVPVAAAELSDWVLPNSDTSRPSEKPKTPLRRLVALGPTLVSTVTKPPPPPTKSRIAVLVSVGNDGKRSPLSSSGITSRPAPDSAVAQSELESPENNVVV